MPTTIEDQCQAPPPPRQVGDPVPGCDCLSCERDRARAAQSGRPQPCAGDIRDYIDGDGDRIPACQQCRDRLNVRACRGCGYLASRRTQTVTAERLCYQCRRDPQRCDGCGCSLVDLPDDDPPRIIDGRFRLCIGCTGDVAFRCEDCDDLTRFPVHADDGLVYCERCFDDRLPFCDECDEHHEGPPCEPPPIMDYDDAPPLIFYGDGPLYLGMELEVEAPGRIDGGDVESVSGDGDEFFCKGDGSLHNGMEIVSHPMTLVELQDRMPWAGIERLRDHGYRSFQTSTCGMHVHLTRAAFHKSWRSSCSSHLWRFLQFHHRNVEQVVAVAGRGDCGWASWDSSERDAVLTYAKGKGHNLERYVAINLQNEDTIELRYFKGTLSPDGIRRNLQFADAVFVYTRDLTARDVFGGDLQWDRFSQWVRGRGEYGDLAVFLDGKGI